MRRAIAALLALAPVAIASAQQSAPYQPFSDHSRSAQYPASREKPWTPVYSASLNRGAALGCSTGVAGRVLCCEPEADADCVAGGGYAWHCYNASGQAITVTNECGNGSMLGPFLDANGSQRYVMKNITDATAPYIAAATAAAQGLDAVIHGAHTLVFSVFNGRTSVGFGYGLASTAGEYINLGTAGVECVSNFNSGAFTNSQVVAVPNAQSWTMGACIYSGTQMTAWSNGNASAAKTMTAPDAPTAYNVYFGRYNSSSYYIGGNLQMFAIYNSALTTATLNGMRADLTGQDGGAVDVAVDRDGSKWFEMADGNVTAFAQDLSPVTSNGLLVWGQVTNYFALSMAMNSQTNIGTPTKTPNNVTGPFASWNGTNEADTVLDDDPAVQEGIQSVSSAGSQTGVFTISCYLAAGTSSEATLAVITNGTGGGGCYFTDLGATFVRKICTPTGVGGSPTNTYGQVLVGDEVDDTGSIKVSMCQLEIDTNAGPPCVCTSAAICTCLADAASVPTTNWGYTRTSVALRYRPMVASGYGTSRELLNAISGANGYDMSIYGTSGVLRWYSSRTGNATYTDTANLTWTKNTEYLIQVQQDNASVKIKRDGTLIKSSSTAVINGGINTTARIGNTGGTQFMDGYVRDIVVKK